MQRALALSLIQVYADISSTDSDGVSKPILFFIDEPETFLHPRAQNKLIDALEKISEKSQNHYHHALAVFAKEIQKETHSMNVFKKETGFNKITAGIEFDIFGKSSPSWGEINYRA